MKSLVLTALMLGVSVGLSAPANADTRADDQKIEAGIVAIDSASGTLHLSNGMVIDRANILQSAALQHLYETEGAAQLQRKVRSTEIRYIANNAKA